MIAWGSRTAAALALALCAAAILLFAASLIPYGAVLGRLEALASTGSAAQSYPAATHARLVLAARLLAAALLGAGLLAYLRRAALVRGLAFLAADARSARREASAAMRAAFGSRRLETAALLALTLAGLALRLLYMERPPRGDEAGVFLTFAQRPLPVIIADYSDVGNHIFHTVLMHLSWLLLGEGLWGMRLPDLIAGMLLIPATYAAARGPYGGATALTAAALVAGSTALIEYSVNGRGYTLQALLVLLLFGIAQLQLARERVTWWAGFALLSALAMWTIPTSAIAITGIGLWYLASILRLGGEALWPRLLHLFAAAAGAGAVTLLFYAPVLLTAGLGHLAYMLRSGSTDLGDEGVLRALGTIWRIWTRNLPTPLGWACLGLLGFGVLQEVAMARRRGSFVPLGLVLGLWLMAFYVTTRTIGYARLWLPFAPFAYLLVSLGLIECLRLVRRAAAGRGETPRAEERIVLAVPLLLFGLLASGELRHHHTAQPDSDSFPDAPALLNALPDLARHGERMLTMQPYGTPLRFLMRAEGFPHQMVSFRATPSARRQAVLAMAGEAPDGAEPRTLLVVTPGGRAGLARVLRYFGLPDATGPIETLLQLPEVTLFRVPDSSTAP